MQPFTAFGHINFRVNDIDASIDFYSKLGFPEFLRLTEEDGSPWIAYMRISDEVYVELSTGGNGGRGGDPVATGLNHYCLTTDNIEETAKQLAAVGINLVSPLDPSRRGADGNRGAWIVDPDGNRIEIMEMAPNCIQYEALKAFHAGKGATSLSRPHKKPAGK